MATVTTELDTASGVDREIARRRIASVDGCSILESGPGFGEQGRHSIYAAFPRATFEITGQKWRLSDDWPLVRPSSTAPPLDALREVLRQTRRAAAAHGPIFQGGWIGLIGYDLAPLLEKLPRRWESTSSVPDLSLRYYDTFVLADRHRQSLEIHAVPGWSSKPRRDRLEEFHEILNRDNPRIEEGPAVRGPLVSDFTREEYLAAVERVREYLRAGDIFQANLSQEFRADFIGRVETLFERAMRLSPAPFGALLRANDWSVVSTSPERFLFAQPSGHVETRPIKGTRARGLNPIHDLLLKSDLAASAKDAAELTMIVDLERNDLGRVCEFGSVRVSNHRTIESFANVHHASSRITGRLRAECDFVDLIRATFPGGSITGAPKIRAMQIIDELERGRRGPYTGAIGYISDHGRMDWNIAIRTIVVDGGCASYRVGGGIVIDSDPREEFLETLAKGQRLRAALVAEDGA